MKKITRETLAASAAARWDEQYRGGRSEKSKEEIGRALNNLGAHPEPDVVDIVIGNDSWTRVPTCGECGGNLTDFVVEVGEESDYESHTAYLCGACITELTQLSDSVRSGEPSK